MPVAELHVRPHDHNGTWVVGFEPSRTALSRHATADEAALEARRVAETRGDLRVFLHDRYQRVRALPRTPMHH
jgi:hypothetical protein